MKKVGVGGTVRVNAYKVVSDAVEQGAIYGWYRAHKYTDKPVEDDAVEAIRQAVLNELCEVLIFSEDE